MGDPLKSLIFVVLVSIVPAYAGVSPKSSGRVLDSSPFPSSEKRQVIAVLDTGIVSNRITDEYLCKGGHVDLTGKGIEDVNGHGTHVAGLIANRMNKEKQCILVVKWYHDEQTSSRVVLGTAIAIMYARSLNPIIINLSLGGESFITEERDEIKKALAANIRVVVASGNRSKNLDNYCSTFPACSFYDAKLKKNTGLTEQEDFNFFVVGSRTDGDYDSFSNFNGPTTNYVSGNKIVSWGINRDDVFSEKVLMSGTSQAAAIFSGKLSRLLLR